MRTGLVLVLAASIGLFFAATAAAATSDHGLYRPPAKLSDASKTIWMTEWVACHHTPLGKLSKSVGVRIPAGRTPQVAATLIAKKAEATLYQLQAEIDIAVDGCRNGILWRFYHGT